MNFQQFLAPLLGIVLVAAAWRAYGWAGLGLAASGLVLWVLLNINRTMQVLKRATDRPLGYVDSAVMLNAKLKPRANLLHVIAMTRALGQPLTPEKEEPEIFRWTDPGGSSVTCEFKAGKLVKWQLDRPEVADEGRGEDAP
ncbi:MAG: putative Glycerate kinase [Ramlibacter sp.]|jgi:hypothetical protein|nr:putative Glycerate kinase [Ramlibacter sp.]